MKGCNIVVTTYGVLTRDPTLRELEWHRVVFDESHIARRPNTQRFRACTALIATHRWAVTGTPLVNGSVADLYYQLRLVKPDLALSVPQLSWASVHFMYLLAHAIVRHTKSMRINGMPILDLPAMRREDVVVSMSEGMSEMYRRELRGAGQVCRATSMARIMVTVDRLRRRCSSGVATDNLLAAGTLEIGAVMTPEEQQIAHERMQEDMCAICLESIGTVAMVRACKHIFCSGCIAEHLHRSQSACCPLCRGRVSFQTLRYMPPPEVEAAVPDCNAKLDRVVREVLSSDETDKFIVFSNFRITLERVAAALVQSDIEFRDLSRKSMTISRRRRIMDEFATLPGVRVLLLPMRSTAVGLNITCANRVVLMEPCLNPALEKQAIGRCWRMGQQKEVTVQRLVVANTIEARIVQANNEMDGVVRDGSGSERVVQNDRDRMRWGYSRITRLLSA